MNNHTGERREAQKTMAAVSLGISSDSGVVDKACCGVHWYQSSMQQCNKRSVHLYFARHMLAFVPPKPKLLVIAAFTIRR